MLVDKEEVLAPFADRLGVVVAYVIVVASLVLSVIVTEWWWISLIGPLYLAIEWVRSRHNRFVLDHVSRMAFWWVILAFLVPLICLGGIIFLHPNLEYAVSQAEFRISQGDHEYLAYLKMMMDGANNETGNEFQSLAFKGFVYIFMMSQVWLFVEYFKGLKLAVAGRVV